MRVVDDFWESFPSRVGKLQSTIVDIRKPKDSEVRAGHKILGRYHRVTKVIMEEAELRQMDSSSLAISADACIEAIGRYPEICRLDDPLLTAIFTIPWPACLDFARDATGRPDQEPAKRQAITNAKGLLDRLKIVLPLELAAERNSAEAVGRLSREVTGGGQGEGNAPIAKRYRLAHEIYERACEDRPNLVGKGQGRYSRALYDYAKTRWPKYAEEMKWPAYESWKRYVREYERLRNGPKNTPRSGRPTGPSIVDRENL